MLNGIELQPVTGKSVVSKEQLVLADIVRSWLVDSHPGTTEKPVDEILDPQFAGMFAYDADGVLVGYIAQRQIDENLHEISSLVISPGQRGHHIGTELLETYAQDLQTNLFPGTKLVAVVHPGSLGVFVRNGFELFSSEIPDEPSQLAVRAQQAGKILVAREAELL